MVDGIAYRIRIIYATDKNLQKIETNLKRILTAHKFKDWVMPNYYYVQNNHPMADIWVTQKCHEDIESRGEHLTMQFLSKPPLY